MGEEPFWNSASISFQSTDLDPAHGEELLRVVFSPTGNTEIRELIDDVLGDHYNLDGPPPFHLDRHESITEWGASGAAVDVAIAVASGTAGQVATYALTRLFGRKKKTKLLPEAEAIQLAQHFVSAQYEVETDSLSIKQYAEEDGLNIVVLTDANREYTVKLQASKRTSETVSAITWKTR